MPLALWARYERLLDEYPLLGRSLTAAAIAGASDASVQILSSILSPASSSRRRIGHRATASATLSALQARRVALW
mgnify:CR=1 FL=1|jgi:hypothetical protein